MCILKSVIHRVNHAWPDVTEIIISVPDLLSMTVSLLRHGILSELYAATLEGKYLFLKQQLLCL